MEDGVRDVVKVALAECTRVPDPCNENIPSTDLGHKADHLINRLGAHGYVIVPAAKLAELGHLAGRIASNIDCAREPSMTS